MQEETKKEMTSDDSEERFDTYNEYYKLVDVEWQWAGVEDFGYAMMGKVEEDASGAFVRAIRRPSGSVFVVQSSGPCFILLISFVGKLLCFKFFSI